MSSNHQSSNRQPSPNIPQAVIAQAKAIARSNAEDDRPLPSSSSPGAIYSASPSSQAGATSSLRVPSPESAPSASRETPIEQQPPPIFSTEHGRVDFNQDGFDTKAKVASDGRLNIDINQKSRRVSDLLVPALRSQLNLQQAEVTAFHPQGYVPPSVGGELDQGSPPPLNVVIHVVGSRGDVQPFIALGKVLKEHYHHRVRLATHSTFRAFVEENGLEYFNIGGDPAELMAFMVKNPGLMPGMDSLKSGDVGKKRKGIYEIVQGCWRSCIEIGDGSGVPVSDNSMDSRSSLDSGVGLNDHSARPFVADAIIANPPSFAHIHCAEKLGIPVHLMFTMPWSPTQAFPHPLANIRSSNADPSITNFISYVLVEMMTWQGLGDIINRFRQKSLQLEPLSLMWAPGMASRLRIPYTYCWSPALIQKPGDWGSHISISGFYFLPLGASFAPEPDLEVFLNAGPPPIYIGFGSIVVDDPNAMTTLIFEAVKKTGQRALVSKGWGGFGADAVGIPEGIFMLGNVPHDWLFKRVTCVVHHGGAGTTAAGIALGKPTVIVPFFGDQPFWGAMVANAGAGPKPIPSKQLTAENLAAGVLEALKPATLARAQELGAKINSENGTEIGAHDFHDKLDVNSLRCTLAPSRAAVWRVKRTKLKLSAFAATTLGNEGLLDFNDLKLYRPREYDCEDGPWDPISGGASALLGTIASLTMGFADFPVEILRALKIKPADQSDQTPAAGDKLSKSAGSFEVSRQSKSQVTPEGTPEDLGNPTEAKHSLPDQLSEQKAQPLHASSGEENHCPPKAMVNALRSPLSLSSSPPSRDRSPTKAPRKSHHFEKDSGQISLDAALGAGKGIGRIVGAGVKSPMDFTLGIARGFHNAPRLYGDQSVRQADKITGLQSGLVAAGKEFGYGFFDGISGLITQPLEGARKEGVAGLVKGFGKGIGGVVLKPGAGRDSLDGMSSRIMLTVKAIWGLPGYTFKGIYKEIQKHLGTSAQNYIVAARTVQGYDDWSKSSREERLDVVSRWHAAQVQLTQKKQHSRHSSFSESSGFSKTKHMSFDEIKKLAAAKMRLKHGHGKGDTSTTAQVSNPTISLTHAATSSTAPDDANEFEEAINASVAATSRGSPEEDEMIERAIRASVLELQSASDDADNESKMQSAIKASISEARRARALSVLDSSADGLDGVDEHDKLLEEALCNSLREHRSLVQQRSLEHPRLTDSGTESDDDEDNQPAMQEPGSPTNSGDLNDVELEKAIELSKQTHQAYADSLAQSKIEEEILLEYVKKQSALEGGDRTRPEISNPLTDD
ncbi:MAG: hypothetical protein Q9163_000866 [Psora crenata]